MLTDSDIRLQLNIIYAKQKVTLGLLLWKQPHQVYTIKVTYEVTAWLL